MNRDEQKPIPVLDHGYIKLIETWGSDERIIEAARMSTNKGFLGWGQETCAWCGLVEDLHEPDDKRCMAGSTQYWTPQVVKAGDEKLLSYLWNNNHATPFEMAGCIVEVQAPIFVFREWHRHRTQSYNELSARYTPLPDVNYIPTLERLMIGSDGKNRQAGTIASADQLTEGAAAAFQETLRHHYLQCESTYQAALQAGIPKELARVHLPVGRYSRMRASANLRNWLGFLTLRQSPKAQYEIRMYANAVHDILQSAFSRTLQLFDHT